jgi:DNA repair exonuclease SbcCD ATPase subunit
MSDIDLSAPEVQDAIKAAIKEATEGLVSKRDELLREVKKLKEGRDIKPEDVAKLEDQIDALKGELSEAQKAAKQALKDAEKASKAHAASEASIAKLLVDNGLSDALVKAGVTNPVLQKAAKAVLAGQVSLADDNGQKVARVGDKALHDYITEWAGTDEGKHFVTAADTSGGGSQGGRRHSGGAAKELTRAAFDALDPMGRAAHFQGGGVVID